MRKCKSESIANVLARYLRDNGIETPLNQRRLIDNWPNIVGDDIAKQTIDLKIKNQTLYVKVASPSLRSDLLLKRKEFVAQLNASVKAQIIADIQYLS